MVPETTNPYGFYIKKYLEINDAAPITLRFRKKTAATAATLVFSVTV